jgi:hypothetical protein
MTIRSQRTSDIAPGKSYFGCDRAGQSAGSVYNADRLSFSSRFDGRE